jgi:hypothetical protein
MQTNMCFAAYAKIKKDVKAKLPPKISKEELSYFEHDFKQSSFIKEVYNIDLKSAYATILFNEGYLSKDTFSYLARLPKHDRLASVGMLAAKKKIFTFNKLGSIYEFEEKISDLEQFFYYAVRRTFEIMQDLKKILSSDYLFTWVDGIYFLPNMEKLVKCENYLRYIKFPYSEEVLTNWKVHMVSGAVRLNFYKDGRPKSFSLPAKQNTFASIIADSLITLNNNKNEKSNNQIPTCKSK